MSSAARRLAEGPGFMGLLLFLVVVLIGYGSLYPFDFSAAGVNRATIDEFLRSWTAPSSRGDILGNIFLFLLFGLLGQLALPPGGRRAARFARLLVFGLAFALALQVAQLFIHERAAVLIDVVWNMVGLVIGALIAFPDRIRTLITGQRLASGAMVPMLLIGAWIASLLVPFVPSIDLELWRDSLWVVLVPSTDPQIWADRLRPLLLRRPFEFDAFIRYLPAWLAAASLGAAVIGERWLTLKLAVVVVATLGLKIVIVNNDLDVTDIAAGAAAVLAFGALIRYLPYRGSIIAALLVAGYVYSGLSPFEARVDAPVFAWMPFDGSLTGSMSANAASIAYKAFLYGALIWLLWRDGLGYVPAVAVAIATAGSVEVGRLYIGHGAPEITDLLLALMAAAVIAGLTRMQRPPAAKRPGRPRRTDPSPGRTTVATPGGGWRGAGLRLAIGIALIAGALWLLLRIPGIPYNVAELFGRGGTLVELVLFALAVISIGAGAAMTAWRLAASRRPWLSLPGHALAATVTTHLLLYLSVTRESLSDIAGSTVFVNRVMQDKVLGAWGADAMQAIGPAIVVPVVNLIEPMLRFAALFTPLVMTLAIFGAVALQIERHPDVSGARRARYLAGRLLVYLAAAAPWYAFFVFIAFVVPSTDNLSELIARDVAFGLGGTAYLYLLLAVISLAAVMLVWSVRRPSIVRLAGAVLLAVASLPLGWWLLQLGLEPQVEKYGLVFSGTDFLLGPNRKVQLPGTDLMLRWFLVQAGALAVITFGAAIAPRRQFRAANE
jgi:VanZ family protein